MAANSEAILNHRYLEMVRLLNVYLNYFPKHEKYALVSIIRNTATMKYYKRLLIEANVLNLLPIGVRKCLSM